MANVFGCCSDPSERPTARTLLEHPFCDFDSSFNFLDTRLHQMIRGNES